MPIRSAVYADLVPASKCLASAFKDEALFGTYMHPYRDQYPDDMYLLFLHNLRSAYFSGPDQRLLVSYKLDPNGKEVITGCAKWTRFRKESQNSIYTKTLTYGISWYNYLESYIYPNRAAEPSRLSILSSLGPYCSHFWSGSRAEVWDLTLLGVDSAQGGQGFGKELVAWGFETAKEESVGCSVVSSEGKEKFYQNCGFNVLAGQSRDKGGEENPLIRENIPGGAVLFWDNGREAPNYN